MKRLRGPRIWTESELLSSWADRLEHFFKMTGPFAELVRLGRWNEQRRRAWQEHFVAGMRKSAAWHQSREAAAALNRDRATVSAAEGKRQQRSAEVRKIDALRAKYDGNLTRAIERHVRTKDPNVNAACKARYYRDKRETKSLRS